MNQILNPNGDDPGIKAILAEHPEVQILWEKRPELPSPLEISGINPILHVMLEGMVENQINAPGYEIIGATMERLQNQGFSKHAARAGIAKIFTNFFFEVLKTKTDFDEAQYLQQVNLLGRAQSPVGRNDPCPCGSGLKYKKCCGLREDEQGIEVSFMDGRLLLGQGSYLMNADIPDNEDPLHPLYQLENRVHIANYLASHQDLTTAVEVLRENITFTQTLGNNDWYISALYDLLNFCLRHRLAEVGLDTIESLLPLVEDKFRNSLLCDRADLNAQIGQVERADQLYSEILESLPEWDFGRYRYALYLEETHRKDQAIEKLRALVGDKANIDRETYRVAKEALDRLTTII